MGTFERTTKRSHARRLCHAPAVVTRSLDRREEPSDFERATCAEGIIKVSDAPTEWSGIASLCGGWC